MKKFIISHNGNTKYLPKKIKADMDKIINLGPATPKQQSKAIGYPIEHLILELTYQEAKSECEFSFDYGIKR